MANYTYPHVDISVKARKRSKPVVAESTATTLLAPFICDRGPTNELVAIDSMAEFVNTYGQLDFSNKNQRQLINIGKWLSGGGRVLACRLAQTVTKTKFEETPSTRDGSKVEYKYGSTQKISLAYETDKFKITYNGPSELTKSYVILLSGEASDTTTDENIKKSVLNAGYKKEDFITDNKINSDVGLMYDASTGYILLFNDECSINTRIDCVSYVKDNVVDLSTTGLAKCDLELLENKFGLHVEAKYIGSYYNNLSVIVSKKYSSSDNIYFNIVVQEKNGAKINKLESFTNIEFDKLYTVANMSNYIGDIYFYKSTPKTRIDYLDQLDASELSELLGACNLKFTPNAQYNLEATTATDGFASGTTDIEEILIPELTKILERPLETPFCEFIDCGYSKQVKLDLIELFCTVTDSLSKVVRNDAFLHLCDFAYDRLGEPTSYIPVSELRKPVVNGYPVDLSNMEIMHHYGKETDIYSKKSGREIKVSALAYKAALLPLNDRLYGPQYTTAGLTRGVIPASCTYINDLPAESTKQEYFDAHLNYVEKDSRAQCFMTELTGDLEDTALSFEKNSRTLLAIKRDIKKLARNYLHEINDRITKKNLENTLNAYLSNWIQLRALSSAEVIISDSDDDPTLSAEQLGISLSIKFRGVINVISTTIIVD